MSRKDSDGFVHLSADEAAVVLHNWLGELAFLTGLVSGRDVG